MIPHEPGDQTGVIRRQSLFQAERFGIHRSKLGVIAAASFGNVVEQRGEITDFGPRQLLHDPRRFGKLVVVARDREPAQVADYE